MLVLLLLVATAIWAALWAYERDAALLLRRQPHQLDRPDHLVITSDEDPLGRLGQPGQPEAADQMQPLVGDEALHPRAQLSAGRQRVVATAAEEIVQPAAGATDSPGDGRARDFIGKVDEVEEGIEGGVTTADDQDALAGVALARGVDALPPMMNSIVLPHWVVKAVCEVKGGAFPSYALGYYPRNFTNTMDTAQLLRGLQTEGLGIDCKVGIAQRAERILLVGGSSRMPAVSRRRTRSRS